jgi:hypothetical protein
MFQAEGSAVGTDKSMKTDTTGMRVFSRWHHHATMKYKTLCNACAIH